MHYSYRTEDTNIEMQYIRNENKHTQIQQTRSKILLSVPYFPHYQLRNPHVSMP